MAKQTDRGLENREIILGVLTEVLEKGSFVHLVLNQALYKYQYLDKADRAFITRVTEGTLEYMLQLDGVINRYSKTKTNKMKPLIRNLLRMSVYQLLYMDRVPDSAVCNEAVKLAVKHRFQGLKGFVTECCVPFPEKRNTFPLRIQPCVSVFQTGCMINGSETGEKRGPRSLPHPF